MQRENQRNYIQYT